MLGADPRMNGRKAQLRLAVVSVAALGLVAWLISHTPKPRYVNPSLERQFLRTYSTDDIGKQYAKPNEGSQGTSSETNSVLCNGWRNQRSVRPFFMADEEDLVLINIGAAPFRLARHERTWTRESAGGNRCRPTLCCTYDHFRRSARSA